MNKFKFISKLSIKIIIFVCFTQLSACTQNSTLSSSSKTNTIKSTFTESYTVQEIEKPTISVSPPTISTLQFSAAPTTLSVVTIPASPSPTKVLTPVLPNADLRDSEFRWVLGLPCKLPCWEGIIIGQSKKAFVEKELSQNHFIVKLDAPINSDHLTFKWADKLISSKNVQDYNENSLFFDKQEIVQSVILVQYIELERIIEYFGQPKYIAATKNISPEADNPEHSSLINSVNLLYPDYGLILRTTQYHKFDITSTLVMQPVFIKPGLDAAKEVLDQGATVLTWQGFNNIDFYCRQHFKPSTPCTDDSVLQ